MALNYDLSDELVKLLIAVLIGGIMGAEREYRNKAAGFRTIILITVGSTLFTIVSGIISYDGRIASNIITGIGFLGAGSIIREGANIKGLTSAATIWISAAIGMFIGIGQFSFAFMAAGIVMIVLYGFSRITILIYRARREYTYRVRLPGTDGHGRDQLEDLFRQHRAKVICSARAKENESMLLTYIVTASEASHDALFAALYADSSILSFEAE